MAASRIDEHASSPFIPALLVAWSSKTSTILVADCWKYTSMMTGLWKPLNLNVSSDGAKACPLSATLTTTGICGPIVEVQTTSVSVWLMGGAGCTMAPNRQRI